MFERRNLRPGISRSVTKYVTRLTAPCQTGNVAHVAISKFLPRQTVVGKLNIAGSLEHDQSQGKNVCRFVIVAHEDLGANVFSIAFSIDSRSCRPTSRHPKIRNLKNAFERDQNVGRFQVQMNETRVMDMFQALRGSQLSNAFIKTTNFDNLPAIVQVERSEERRVGKECRS